MVRGTSRTKAVIYSEEIETEIKKNFSITPKPRDDAFGVYPGCVWWRLTYQHLFLSLYYDPTDSLGIVGAPYYELYDGNETYRFLESGDPMELIFELHQNLAIYEAEFAQFPERFL